MRIGLRLVSKADELEQLMRPFQALTLCKTLDLQWQRDVFLDGFGGKQIEMLEDHADAAAQRLQVLF